MPQAVIACNGKQYLVHRGSRLTVDRIPGAVGDAVEFPTLLTFEADGPIAIGQPRLPGAVKAKIVAQSRAPKLTVIKFKRKVRYRRKRGYRQARTTLEFVAV